MGWWRIDPKTGMPLTNKPSKLSRKKLVLLNAVSGVDDDVAGYYLGDGPWDMAYSVSRKIAAAADRKWRRGEVRALLMKKVLPRGLKVKARARLKKAVDQFWKSVDYCYDHAWQRPALPAERRWVCDYAVQRVVPGEDDARDA